MVGHFRKSSKATDSLLPKQERPGFGAAKPKKLIQDCPTRWNSQLFMLERLVLLHLELVAVLNDGTVSSRSNPALDLTPVQWNMAKELVSVLKPVEQTT